MSKVWLKFNTDSRYCRLDTTETITYGKSSRREQTFKVSTSCKCICYSNKQALMYKYAKKRNNETLVIIKTMYM